MFAGVVYGMRNYITKIFLASNITLVLHPNATNFSFYCCVECPRNCRQIMLRNKKLLCVLSLLRSSTRRCVTDPFKIISHEKNEEIKSQDLHTCYATSYPILLKPGAVRTNCLSFGPQNSLQRVMIELVTGYWCYIIVS